MRIRPVDATLDGGFATGEVGEVLFVILVTLRQILFSAKMVPEGRARDAEHYLSIVLWDDTTRWPEVLTSARHRGGGGSRSSAEASSHGSIEQRGSDS